MKLRSSLQSSVLENVDFMKEKVLEEEKSKRKIVRYFQ